ncbi:MAG: NAD(P)-dependent dehydrogenase (short-subunit alcohol dehydrogenase family)/acyl dehydratase, partial [Kiritimatiellia bacterium]
MGLLDGKVVLVTGAGGGIGRAHALACAADGAHVVVNDLGGVRDGTGAGQSMADTVVDEIRALGAQAVANYDSVTDPDGCDRMVRAALDNWGRLDVVVNNAGILRDRTFRKMADAEWGLVLDVHLNGTRAVCRAALPALLDGGGAIINTTSYSGMIGNYGQSNYAAAKAGIYGLSRVLSMELRKAGVTVNCIAPVAKTRMTDDIAMVADEWGPEQISPMVVFLASDLAKNVTGKVFGVQGQRLHVYEVMTNDGVQKEGTDLWTAQEIADRLGDIEAFASAAQAPVDGDDTVTRAFAAFPAGYKAGAIRGWNAVFHWKVAGGTDQTLVIEDDVCTVAEGLNGTATCTVKTSSDVVVALLHRELDPQQVFMTGKASADNMGDLMKMAMVFDFQAMADHLAASAGESVDPSDEALPEAVTTEARVVPIGKRYDAGYWLVDREEFQLYASATDDANTAYVGPDAIAPPMYHVRAFIDLMMTMATDPELELDVLRLVHGEHDMRFHRPLRHGDILQVRGELQSVQDKSSGTVVTYGMFGFVDGELAIEGHTTYFVRGKSKKKASGAKPAPSPLPAADW